MSALTGPRLLLGDFNISEYTYAYVKLSDNYSDVHRETGRGFGFTFPKGIHINNLPVPGPFVRLDYIFHSAELEAQQSRVKCDTGSDHCYVVAELTLQQSENGD